ncbi:M15 family metallopeptidase [Flavobacterium alkalisoli]|uniref:D-alanyl-D-alanine dipeptidase n=1 Tax=Flavobacterium alkalisoli TaxID=2602769 RepID=A0A5B9FWT2_9FLAO|nr:M15 family metallopeptidase [Flavobacterium alkalisoli]QEE51395.1 M15 family metallopeptidase [Flavobacterium alkalisoli]
MKTFGVIVLVIVLFALSTAKVDDKRLTEDFHHTIVMKDTANWAEIKMDTLDMVNKMAYADTANFMKQKIYPCARCFLRPEVAEALEKANMLANAKNLKLVIFDCYRPYGYQQKMYEIVNNPKYVAPPGKGSNHNRGAAVDLSLADENGDLLDMGNEFDDFSSLSHYMSDKISEKAQNNRKLLRVIMNEAGFTPYDNEWWHFDYRKKKYETSDFRWECNEQTQQ